MSTKSHTKIYRTTKTGDLVWWATHFAGQCPDQDEPFPFFCSLYCCRPPYDNDTTYKQLVSQMYPVMFAIMLRCINHVDNRQNLYLQPQAAISLDSDMRDVGVNVIIDGYSQIKHTHKKNVDEDKCVITLVSLLCVILQLHSSNRSIMKFIRGQVLLYWDDY